MQRSTKWRLHTPDLPYTEMGAIVKAYIGAWGANETVLPFTLSTLFYSLLGARTMTAAFKILLPFVVIGCAVAHKDVFARRLDHAHHNSAYLARRNDGADPLRFAAANSHGPPSAAPSAGQTHYATDVSGFTGGEMLKHCPKDFFIGTAIDNPELKFPELATVAKEFSWYTPGNSLKMVAVYENEQSWTELRTGVDKLVGGNGEFVNWKYHTLIWGAEQSQTMMQKSFSKEAMMKTITDFVSTKMCPKIMKEAKFWGIDVLNEVFADDGSGFKKNGYFEVIGEEGYKQVLKLVKQKCPDYKIIVNEYGLEGPNPKADFAFKTIKRWLAEGVPVDVVGLQFHIQLDNRYEDMLGAINRWTKEKIAVVLSEVDIPVNLPPSPQDLEKQAQQYGNVFQAALEGGAFGVTVWGTLDKGSWFGTQQIPGVGHGKTGAPLLFSDDGKPKPAVAAIVDVFKRWGDKPVGFEGGRLSDTTAGNGQFGLGSPAPDTVKPMPKEGHSDASIGAALGGDGTAVPIIGDPTGNGSGQPSTPGDKSDYGSGNPTTPPSGQQNGGVGSGYGSAPVGAPAASQGSGQQNGGGGSDKGTDAPSTGQDGNGEQPKKKHHGHQGHHHKDQDQNGADTTQPQDGQQNPYGNAGQQTWQAWPNPYGNGGQQKGPNPFGNGGSQNVPNFGAPWGAPQQPPSGAPWGAPQQPPSDFEPRSGCVNAYDSHCNADAGGNK